MNDFNKEINLDLKHLKYIKSRFTSPVNYQTFLNIYTDLNKITTCKSITKEQQQNNFQHSSDNIQRLK